MKRLLFSLITILITTSLLAQTDNYKMAIDSFQANYNAEKFDEIFNSFSSEMKQALPLEDTREFFKGLKSQVGNIESKEFFSFQKGTYASYKTQFENAVLSVNISLDNENQINGLFIKSYEEPKVSEKITVNALYSYPEGIAGIIFSKTKDLPDNTQLSIALTRDGNTDGLSQKTSYQKLLQKPIFNKYKMTSSFTSSRDLGDRLVKGQNTNENPYPIGDLTFCAEPVELYP